MAATKRAWHGPDPIRLFLDNYFRYGPQEDLISKTEDDLRKWSERWQAWQARPVAGEFFEAQPQAAAYLLGMTDVPKAEPPTQPAPQYVAPEFAKRYPTAAAVIEAINRLVYETTPGQAVKRSSEAGVESLFSAPGAVGEMQGGYTTTGVPALDVGAATAGSIAGKLAQLLAASRYAGAIGAAAGQVPAISRAAEAAPRLLTEAGRYAGTLGTKWAMERALAPEEGKPSLRELATEVAFGAGAGAGGALAAPIIQAVAPTAPVFAQAAARGAARAVAGGAAAYPFAEDKGKAYIRRMGLDMLAAALMEVGSLAINPAERRAAEAARQKVLQEIASRKELQTEAFRTLGLQEPPTSEESVLQAYRARLKEAARGVAGASTEAAAKARGAELAEAKSVALQYVERLGLPKRLMNALRRELDTVVDAVVETLKPKPQGARAPQGPTLLPAPVTNAVAVPQAPPPAPAQAPVTPRIQPPAGLTPEQTESLRAVFEGKAPGSYGAQGVPKPAPVAPAATPAKALETAEPALAVKEPWQMTREEFLADARRRDELFNAREQAKWPPDKYSQIGLGRGREMYTGKAVELLHSEYGMTKAEATRRLRDARERLARVKGRPVAYSGRTSLEEGTTTVPTYLFRTEDVHEVGRRYVVERALAEGKAVPPEVLADYPDLAQQARKAEAAKPAPLREMVPVATGKPATVKTERGTAIDTKYAVVDARALISSHDTALRPDPRFPAELQPRERARAASEEQITRIANKLEPEFLGESPKASEGAPIIGPDGVVESGNARVIALKRVYEQAKPGAETYKRWLLDNAGRFGLDKAAIEQAGAPVLVRVRQTPVDREEFVREANEAAVAAMSATEQATADAKQISGGLMNLFRPNDEGEIATLANRDFIRGFLDQVVGPTERGRYVTAEGGLSQEGIARIRNAVFARAYGDPTAIAKLAESPDNNVRNITGAMLIAAPRLADVKERIAQGRLFDLDITGDIAAAMRKLSELRERGEPVEAYLEQRSMFGEEELSPFGKELLRAFSKYATSRKKVTELLLAYAEAVEAAGDPSQGVLFGEHAVPSKQEALEAALQVMEVRYAGQEGQASLFGAAAPVRGETPHAPRLGEAGAGRGGPQGYSGTGATPPSVATVPSLPKVEEELRLEVDRAIEEVSPPAGMSVRMVTKPPPEAPRAEKQTFTDPEIEARWKAAQGVQRPPLSARLREFVGTLYRKATREFEHLPRTAEFAPLRFGLLRLQKQKDVAADRTLRMQQGITVNLDPARMDLFTRKVILDDLAHEAEKERLLPFGFTPESLAKEKAPIDRAATEDRVVAEAVRKRRVVWDAIKKDYVDAMKAIGFDVSERLTNEDYFRHQVLEYAQVKGLYGAGKKLKTPAGRGFLKKREGSELDINTDYLQAEFEVMAQMLYDIEVARTIRLVNQRYNIADKLRAQAKEQSTPEKPVNWRDLIPEGYTTWQPREGSVFFLTTSIPAKLAEMLQQGALEEVGLTAEDLRPILAVGGPRREFVVKQEVADTLDNLTRPPETNTLAIASREITRTWKVWTLLNPRRWFKYNFRNLSGDAEAVFVGNPSAFRKVPQAVREAYQVFVGDRAMSEEMAEWFQRGGMQTLLQVQELGDINRLKMFQHLYEAKGTAKEVPLKVWQAYWKAARLSTDFREAILRYAAYLDYLEQMRKDPKGKPRNFGASMPEEVMALDDIRDRAFMLSNDLLGPYDRISVLGKEAREHLAPFWSWQEVNFKRYIQLWKNAARDRNTASALGRKLAGTAIRSPLIAFNIGKFALKALALWGVLAVWNYTFFRDEEEELPPDVQGRPHIVLGRTPDGKIRYFDRLGMLSDFLEWFGADDAPQDVRDFLNGKRTLAEIAADTVKAPVNKLVQAVTPLIKAPMEALTKRKLYPDVFQPGRVRDVGLYIAQSLNLEAEYRSLRGLPSRPYGRSLSDLFVYEADPGEAAYWAIIDEKERFLKKIGKWTGGYSESQRGYALYNYKTALRYKDKEAADRYLAEYFLLGGTRQGLQRSLDSMDPLYGLKGADRVRFVHSLTEEDKKRLALAQEFYRTLRYAR